MRNVIEVVLRIAIVFRKIAKITQRLGVLPPGPLCYTLKFYRFFQRGAYIRQFLNKKKKKDFGSSPLFLRTKA